MQTSPKELLLGRRPKPDLSGEGALSTGSTLLNLACTDRPGAGFLKGGYYYLVGDSTSGKTWISMTCFAEATLNAAFKDYRLIFDDVENGALMDVEHYFGKAVARRMEPPAYIGKKPVFSSTVESFYYHLSDAIADGRPFIYVLDSQDALTSVAAKKKFSEQKSASGKGEQSAGSFGDGKAKYHSENLRIMLAGIKKIKSILIVIGQTRDNLGFGFEKKTRSGGKALRFYANLEIWTSVGKKIKKLVRGKDRTVGVRCLAEIKKNRVTGKIGKDRSVEIPIYYGLGIDDVGSCVDYLLAEKHWTKKLSTQRICFSKVRAASLSATLRKKDWKRKSAPLLPKCGPKWRRKANPTENDAMSKRKLCKMFKTDFRDLIAKIVHEETKGVRVSFIHVDTGPLLPDVDEVCSNVVPRKGDYVCWGPGLVHSKMEVLEVNWFLDEDNANIYSVLVIVRDAPPSSYKYFPVKEKPNRKRRYE